MSHPHPHLTPHPIEFGEKSGARAPDSSPRTGRGGRLASGLVAIVLLAGCVDRSGETGPTPVRAEDVASRPAAALPDPRTEVAGVALGGGIIAVGGLQADGSVSDAADRFDLATGTWAALPALPRGLHHAGVAALGGRVYVAGGYAAGPGNGWEPRAEVLSLAPGEPAWRPEPPLPRPRGALALAAARGTLVAIGGVVDGRPAASVEQWRPGVQAGWLPAPDLPREAEHLAAAGTPERVYAIAGRTGGLETNQVAVASWMPGDPAWRAEPALIARRGGTSAAAVSGTVCVAGGEEPAGTIALVECLRDGQWRPSGQLTTPRHGLVVAGAGDALHVIGGGPQPGLTVSGTHEVLTIPRP